MNKEILKNVKVKTAHISLMSNGIVEVLYLENSDIGVEDKKEQHAAYQEITGGVKHPFLFFAQNFVSFTKEAKEYGIEVELEQPFLATAIVVQNTAYKLVADFYFKFYKPKVPYKVFFSKEKAELWLIDFRDNPNANATKKQNKMALFSY